MGEVAPPYPVNISYSKFPADLKIILRSYSDNEVCELYLQVAVFIRNELAHIIEFNSDTPDHIVLNSTWYPFTPGDIEYIRDVLSKASISASGKISLKQYLALKCNINNDSKLVDEVSEGIKNQSKIITRTDEKFPCLLENYTLSRRRFNWLK